MKYVTSAAQALAWLFLAALVSSVHADTVVGELEPTGGTWRVYQGSRYVCRGNSESEALTCAGADAEARDSTTRYQLRYPNRYFTVTFSAPEPPPVDCAVSVWSAWTDGEWSACADGTQSRQEARSRTVVTEPANGGAECPALTETRTASQDCTVEPPSGAITNLPVVCTVSVAEGAGIRSCPWADQRFEPASLATLVRHCANTSCTPSTAIWRRMSNVTSGYVEVCTAAKLPGDPVAGGNCGVDAQGEWGGMAYVAPSQVARAADSEPPPPAEGTAALSWQHTGLRVDGASSSLAGFRIHYGTSPEVLHEVIQLANPGVRAYTVTDLAAGTYYFGVRAYDAAGTESALSNIAQKTVQ